MALQSLSFSGALLFVLQKTHFFLLFSLVFGCFFFHCLWVGFFVVVFSQLLFPCCLLLLLLYTRLVKISCAGGADLWAAHSASIAVTRNTTVYFIRSQMKWNGPRTCTVTWAWIKVQIGVLLPGCCHPPPSDGTNSTHVLGCSTRQCPGGKGLWGPPGVLGLGSSHCPCQGAGCWGGWNGIPGRLGRAIKAHACPRVWQHPPWFHPGAKPPALKGAGEKEIWLSEGQTRISILNLQAVGHHRGLPLTVLQIFIVFSIVYFIIYPTDSIYSWGVES